MKRRWKEPARQSGGSLPSRVKILHGEGEKNDAKRDDATVLSLVLPFRLSRFTLVHCKCSLASVYSYSKEKCSENRGTLVKADDDARTEKQQHESDRQTVADEITRGRKRGTRGETTEINFSLRFGRFDGRKRGKQSAATENQRSIKTNGALNEGCCGSLLCVRYVSSVYRTANTQQEILLGKYNAADSISSHRHSKKREKILFSRM